MTLLVGHDDLDNGRLPSALKRCVIVIDVGWQEEFGIEKEPLERREVRDLCEIHESISNLSRKLTTHEELTKRGGPSGSPMLMVVVSDLERASPVEWPTY